MELPRTMLRNFYVAVRSSDELARCNHVLVAVSGGPDSMALLDEVLTVATFQPMSVSVAHFDHTLRHDSGRDRELVERFCDERGVDCYVGEADVRGWAERHGKSIEAAARELRYAFLEKTADAVGADRILTAHTRNDNIETVLMRILRGSGIRGLAGIPQSRGRILRPLLHVDRDQVIDHCTTRGIPYVEDPSNRDTRFERNDVRHRLLPALRAMIPGVNDHLEEIAAECTDALAVMRQTTDPLLDAHLVQEGPGVWRLPLGVINGQNPTARFVLIADALYYRMGVSREFGHDHYDAIFAVARGEGLSRSLPETTVRREHDFLVFYHGVDVARRSELVSRDLPVPGDAHIFGYRVRARLLTRRDAAEKWTARGAISESGGERFPAVAYFARERLAPPLIVRSPAPGDRVRPFGMGGHRKKLSDIFIDRKIPYRVRSTIPVVEDRDGIIWVAGVTTSETTRITDGTGEVVELRVDTE